MTAHKGQRSLVRLMGLAGTMLALTLPGYSAPAQAGVFDFLFGGRDSRGRAAGRTQGGAVRSGQLVGGLDASIPYLLTPRNTYQITSRFLIRWYPVPGAQRYTVRLWRWGDAYGQRQDLLWETTTSGSAVIYDGEVPLNPARFYSVEVVSDTGRSSDQDLGCATAGFSLLFPENLAQLRSDLATIAVGDRPAAAVALDLAAVYLQHGMLDVGIATLEPYADATTDATVVLALAELYSYSGLTREALSAYQRGLDLAAAANDPLDQAIALEGIGTLNTTLIATKAITPTPPMATALAPLSAASNFYRIADQPLAADRLDRRLDSLRRYDPATDSLVLDNQVCRSKGGG